MHVNGNGRIFKGDMHVNGNGRDTYKFRTIHPFVHAGCKPKNIVACSKNKNNVKSLDSVGPTSNLCEDLRFRCHANFELCVIGMLYNQDIVF